MGIANTWAIRFKLQLETLRPTVPFLPKVELHLHLDCSLSYAAVSRLAPDISREEYDEKFIAPPQCSSLADFLTRAPRGFQLMQTAEALRIVTEDVFEQLDADKMIYAELRFAPLLHTYEGLAPDAVVAAVDRATEECIRSTGIEARLILCTLRHFSTEQSLETARLVKQFRGSRVVALDIAGDEAGFPIDPHIAAYRFAIENGLNRTAHAGEARGAESVWETLKAFAPTRIGHGVRSVEDPALVDHLRVRKIHLEVCPSSNVQTRAFPTYAEHCIDELYRSGVSLGINTDARTITNVTLEQEYARLIEAFGWGNEELVACNRKALRAAFIDDGTRARLLDLCSAPGIA
jgi:adenosine deaminase